MAPQDPSIIPDIDEASTDSGVGEDSVAPPDISVVTASVASKRVLSEETGEDTDDSSKQQPKNAAATTDTAAAAAASSSEEPSIVAKRWPQKCAAHMANHSCQWFAVAWALTLALSAVGIIVGNFEVAVDNAGWNSRGTLIANRQTQVGLVTFYRLELAQPNNEQLWDDLLNNVQPGWETDDDDDDFEKPDDDLLEGDRRQLLSSRSQVVEPHTEHGTPRWDRELRGGSNTCPVGFALDQHSSSRRLQDDEFNVTLVAGLEGCDTEW